MVVAGNSLGWTMPGRKWWVLVVLAVLGLLIVAWIDGGERQLRPIAEEIAVPGSAQ